MNRDSFISELVANGCTEAVTAVLTAVAQLYIDGAKKGNNEGYHEEIARAAMRCLNAVIEVAYQFGEGNNWGFDKEVGPWINEDRWRDAMRSDRKSMGSPLTPIPGHIVGSGKGEDWMLFPPRVTPCDPFPLCVVQPCEIRRTLPAWSLLVALNPDRSGRSRRRVR